MGYDEELARWPPLVRMTYQFSSSGHNRRTELSKEWTLVVFRDYRHLTIIGRREECHLYMSTLVLSSSSWKCIDDESKHPRSNLQGKVGVCMLTIIRCIPALLIRGSRMLFVVQNQLEKLLKSLQPKSISSLDINGIMSSASGSKAGRNPNSMTSVGLQRRLFQPDPF